MKRIASIVLALACVTAFAGIASANPCAPGIRHREVRQSMRIRQGVRSGELTRRETVRLRMGERRIHRMDRRFHSDGQMTRGERVRTHRALDRESRRIYRLKHNGRQA